MTRRQLPDGRVLLFERWDVPPALGGPSWKIAFEDDPENPAVGAPLIVVLALFLGYELIPPAWPWWIYALADEVEASFATVT
jgi:hypothetical protein